jgi:hypothetical protein
MGEVGAGGDADMRQESEKPSSQVRWGGGARMRHLDLGVARRSCRFW